MAQDTTTTRVTEALTRVTEALDGGEERPGQQQMALAVADSIEEHKHLLVQAGTGTGKSLGYLVPAILGGETVVVATATKALQDQLADKDLPLLAKTLPTPFSYAVLKGRSNYVCVQRLNEIEADADQMTLAGVTDRTTEEQLADIAEWAGNTSTGDRAELRFEPSERAWASVSVSSRECPGASKCPAGGSCWADAARARASAADVVIVNTHLYGLGLAAEGAIVPEHDVAIIDEAHQFEDVISATAGIELGAGRFRALRRVASAIIDDDETLDRIDVLGERIETILAGSVDHRFRKGVLGEELSTALMASQEALRGLLGVLAGIDASGTGIEVVGRLERARQVTTSLITDIGLISEMPESDVAWVEGPADKPTLRLAPIDVSGLLLDRLWSERTAILTSATLSPGLAERLGVPADSYTELDVGSPFDYERQALLYCAAHLPDPRAAEYEDALVRELETLITAAGGRTLALFTSWRMMRAAAERLEPRLPWPTYTQADMPKPALLETFREEEESCLFATMGFWQGIDVPGPALSLVTIDKLPFPRPDNPLLQARREQARQDAFRVVDLPRAVTLTAQAAGRLIRTSADTGVVAVLDPRLANKASYRWDIVGALPPMRRTKDQDEVTAFLRELRDARS